MSQDNKFDQFQALHKGPEPLVLYNVWDAASAKIVEESGARAIATGSWSVAAAQGYPDGEALPFERVIQTIETIAAQTTLPVSLDFECGYADTLEALAKTAEAVFKTGIVGINFEDQRLPTPASGPALIHISDQCERIACLRAVADMMNLPIFINARTDIFLQSDAAMHAALIPDAIERGKAYAASGASGIFVPGLSDLKMIEAFCAAIDLPVNVMASPPDTDIEVLSKAGVKRVSYGPHPYRRLMAQFKNSAENIYAQKD